MISVGVYQDADAFKKENHIIEYTQELKNALLKGEKPDAYIRWYRDCPEKMEIDLKRAKDQMLPCLEIMRRLEKAGETLHYSVDLTPSVLLLVQHFDHLWWLGGTCDVVPYELQIYINCFVESRWPTYSHA